MVRSSAEAGETAGGVDARPSAGEGLSPPRGEAIAPTGAESHRARPDAVLEALAEALRAAAAAGRFDVVEQLARELQARRLAASSENVVPLDGARERRRPRT